MEASVTKERRVDGRVKGGSYVRKHDKEVEGGRLGSGKYGGVAELLKNPFILKKSIWINPFWINPDKIVDFFNRWIFSKMRHTM